MSYILDALTQSELERERGTVPDLRSAHALLEDEPKEGRRWIHVAVTVLLCAGAGFAAWLYTRIPDSTPDHARVAQGQRQEVRPLEGATSAAVSPPAVAVPAPAAAPAAPSTEQQAGTASHEKVKEIESAPKPRARRAQAVAPQPVTRERSVPPPVARERAAPEPVAREPVRKVRAVPPSQSGEPAIAASPSGQTVESLGALPSSIRQELPGISISGYLHSPQPSERMVLINDRVAQQGDEIAVGLKVEEISSNGVTFSYKGYRFRGTY